MRPAEWNITPALTPTEFRWVWQDPLIAVAFWEGQARPYDHVQGQLSDVTTGVWTPEGFQTDGVTNQLEWRGPEKYNNYPTDEVCIAAFVRRDGLGETSGRIFDLGSNNIGVNRSGGSTTSNQVLVRTSGGTNVITIDIVPDDGQFYLVSLRFSEALGIFDGHLIDRAGKIIDSSSGTPNVGTPNVGGVNEGVSLGSQGSGAFNSNHTFAAFYAWNRIKIVAQLQQLARDPHGPFRMVDEIGVVIALPVVGGARPQGPFGHPFHGPFAGPIG